MKLRKATLTDSSMLLKWRNHPSSRQNSHTSDLINEDTHNVWFKNSLSNPKREIYILEAAVGPVATIRADEQQPLEYLLSWMVSPDARNKGYGTAVLGEFLNKKTGKFIAEIKPENIPSIKMVEAHSFIHTQTLDSCLVFTKTIKVSDEDLINKIQEIRSSNNVNWMDILRVAMKHDPLATKRILSNINSSDTQISSIVSLLALN